MKSNFVVLDVETQDSFQAVGAWDASKLHVSVAGLYSSTDDKYHTFLEDELNQAWAILEQADTIVGFNLFGFDYPVLQKYFAGVISKLPTLDIMAEFKKAHGHRIKLDSLARENLGTGKSGDGLQAIRLWEQGKIDELKNYCLDDVKITRDLYLKGLTDGVLYYENMGARVTWMVDWAKIKVVDNAISLPF